MKDEHQADLKFDRRNRTTPRKGDGGVYLVIVDDTPEFEVALRYAARCAESRRGHVALLYIFDVEEFQDWGNVEEKILQELRLQAEEKMKSAAEKIHALTQKYAAIYIATGAQTQKIIEIINFDDSLVCLVLGGGVQGSSANPLIQHFTGKALGKLRVPIIIVPGNLDLNRIDAIT